MLVEYLLTFDTLDNKMATEKKVIEKKSKKQWKIKMIMLKIGQILTFLFYWTGVNSKIIIREMGESLYIKKMFLSPSIVGARNNLHIENEYQRD